jgi:hypothetical protein
MKTCRGSRFSSAAMVGAYFEGLLKRSSAIEALANAPVRLCLKYPDQLSIAPNVPRLWRPTLSAP